MEQLDGSGSDAEWAAVRQLRQLGPTLAGHLLRRFRAASSWKVRSACVYHSVRYARHATDAVTLGLEALDDRSKIVRYRGCMLLAYSLRTDVLARLQDALAGAADITKPDILAAIDAIESQNHNFFVDRDHSGKVKLNVG